MRSGLRKTTSMSDHNSQWAEQGSNLRPTPCKGSRDSIAELVVDSESLGNVDEFAHPDLGPVGFNWAISGPVSGTLPAKQPSGLRALDGGRYNLLSVRQVAARLGVSTATVYALVERGGLPHVRISNAIRVLPGDLATFLSARRKERS